ncbi:THAP domain-containing protein 2-like [Acyrthosiphon pisum]|nr:THAP domain-containing protein 2-like isoform X2 [Acyrthosiphon pisum]XP_029341560.1 THAP domain-containing protein 2-like [Acyrthosiphon pisum]|eukprot:XP_016659942.1 PREDICTED: THAP domain-containing protein 2-like [Acyrthosiphon pisum]
MVWSCCIPFCESKGNKGSKLKLHKFPLDKNRQTLWVKSIQNFEPSYIMKKSHYVCQCHFLSTDYELNNLLKKTAVPSVFSEVITLLPYTIFEDNSNFPSQ